MDQSQIVPMQPLMVAEPESTFQKYKIPIIAAIAVAVVVVIIIIIVLAVVLTRDDTDTSDKKTADSSDKTADSSDSNTGTDTKEYNLQECANENQNCKIGPSGKVRYYAKNIAGKKFTAGNDIDCNNTTFTDPAPGVYKACYTSTTSDNYPFTKCSDEGGKCKVGPKQIVVYASNAFKEKTGTAGTNIMCSNDNMGGDPIPGKAKACFTGVTM